MLSMDNAAAGKVFSKAIGEWGTGMHTSGTWMRMRTRGLDEAMAKFSGLRYAISRRIVDNATKKGARILAKPLRRMTKRVTGAARKAITVANRKKGTLKRGQFGAVVFFKSKVKKNVLAEREQKSGWYGRLLSSGWQHVSHGIRGRRIAGTHAMETAFNSSRMQAARVTSDAIVSAVERYTTTDFTLNLGGSPTKSDSVLD